jgi:hypothetical protein
VCSDSVADAARDFAEAIHGAVVCVENNTELPSTASDRILQQFNTLITSVRTDLGIEPLSKNASQTFRSLNFHNLTKFGS